MKIQLDEVLIIKHFLIIVIPHMDGFYLEGFFFNY